MMKKLGISAALILTGIILFAQNEAIDKVFEKYALRDGMTTVDISARLMDIIYNPYNDNEIRNIKILSVEDPVLDKGLNFYNEIVPQLRLKDYVTYLHMKNVQLIIMRKKHSKGLQEFILVTGGECGNNLVYIEGEVSLYQLYKLSKQLEEGNVPMASNIKRGDD